MPDQDSSASGTALELDLDAYLHRIAHTGNREATLGTLRQLQQAHLATIPFENLDVRLGRPIHLDLEHLQRKMVDRRRGGYCFEQNTLFAAALRRLGFAVSTLEARVRPADATTTLPRTHMTLSVIIKDRVWLADVGFGSDGPLVPIALDGTVSRQPGGVFRTLTEASGIRVLQIRTEDGWQDLYAFSLVPALPVDFVVANHFTSTHPMSDFVRTLTVQRTRSESRHILRNRTYIERSGGEERTRELPDAQVPPLLREVFGLEVEDDEVLEALAPPPSI